MFYFSVRVPWQYINDAWIVPQEKILYVPPPDYSSQLMITELVLAKACGTALPVVPKALVQTLAHISNIYTPKFLERAVRMTINPRRLQRLGRKPLCVDEFVPALASFDPVYKESDADPTQNRIELFKVSFFATMATPRVRYT